jgi:hypothetical protein
MNLSVKSEESLDNLSVREKFTDHSRERWRDEFPYKRMRRWIQSCVGHHIDDVIHEFVNSTWIPRHHRRASTLRRYIEFDTFLKNGEVYYYTEYGMMGKHNNYSNFVSVKVGHRKTIYVDPTTKIVSVCVHPSKKNTWQLSRKQHFDSKCRILGDYHQLCKIDGIWYEIKGEIVPSYALRWAFDHNIDRKKSTDILTEPSSNWQNKDIKIPHVKIVLKRQLSAKELKNHNLKNGRI